MSCICSKTLFVYLQSQRKEFIDRMLLSSFTFYLFFFNLFFFVVHSLFYFFCRWYFDRPPQHSMLYRTVLSVSVTFLRFQCLSKKHRKKKKTAIRNPLGWPLLSLGTLHSQGCIHQKDEFSVQEEKALQQGRHRVSRQHLEPNVRWIISCNMQQLLLKLGLIVMCNMNLSAI